MAAMLFTTKLTLATMEMLHTTLSKPKIEKETSASRQTPDVCVKLNEGKEPEKQ